MTKKRKKTKLIRGLWSACDSMITRVGSLHLNQKLMSVRKFYILLLIFLYPMSLFAQVEERTVIDNERGFLSEIFDGEYDKVGILLSDVERASVEAIKLMQAGKLKQFSLPGFHNLGHFPYEEFIAFEAEELARGKDPIWITATHEGSKKPVIRRYHWRKSLYMNQAVNIGDDRFTKFWVKNYVRTVLDAERLQNWGVYIDGIVAEQELYVVLDDEGNWYNVPWDEPFPQNDQECAEAARHCLRRIKELAPDLIAINNGASDAAYPCGYEDIYGPTDGLLLELFCGLKNFLAEEGSPFDQDRSGFWEEIQRLIPPDGSDAYKIQIFPGQVYSDEANRYLFSRFISYLMFSGPNAFFKPCNKNSPGGSREVDPLLYADIKNALGSPISPPQSQREPGQEEGFRLFWRRCEGGIIYFNMTGLTKTITLPDDSPYFDANGNPITTITLGDLEGEYATTEPGRRVAKPRINPRRPVPVYGPLVITLETEPFSTNTRIVYTLDDSEPDRNSTVYTGPFEIHQSCVVKAKAFDAKLGPSSRLPSFTKFATYTITDEKPTVQFHLRGDSGSEFLEHDYPVVSLSYVSSYPIAVKYAVVGGTAENRRDYRLVPDVLIIRPGEQHRYFSVRIINDSNSEPDETIEIAISDPVNATLGENTIYTYTIEDNDREPPVRPSPVPAPPPPPPPGDPLAEALDTPLHFTTGGKAGWFAQTMTSYYDGDAAQSGGVSHDEESWMQTTVSGTGAVTFYWKVSSEYDYDFLEFYIDGSLQDQISGSVNWQQKTYTISTLSSHTLEWRYVKDSGSDSGSDCGWVDKVEWLPIP